MRRLLLISLATVPLTGCQFFYKGPEAAVIDSLDSTSLGEAVSSLSNGAEDADAEAFADPTVKSAGAAVSADLIKSTDASARTLKVQRSRNDPFATLPIPPPPELVELPVGAAGNGIAVEESGASRSTSSRGSGDSRGASAGTSASARNGSGAAAATARRAPTARRTPTPPPVRVRPANRPLVTPSPIATLPRVPQPVIAQAVSVSGVVQLENEPYAILRSGSEPERYVKVGDRIAGGSVRVKRIETLAFEPRVILEENGIEVSKSITASASAGSPTPALPVSTPPASVPPMPPISGNQTLLPNVPVIPIPTASTTLQPALGNIPSSLILSSPETNT